MIVFINGGSGSGKSAFAEKIAASLGGPLIYVATMPVFSKEDEKKVERHHKLRAGKGFQTLERPQLLVDIPNGSETVLIECMSTHTANVLFDQSIVFSKIGAEQPDLLLVEGSSPKQKAECYLDLIKKEITAVLQRKGNTVFVSAEVAEDGQIYDEETEIYKSLLTKVNTWLMSQADAGFEVVCGIPVPVKGEFNV